MDMTHVPEYYRGYFSLIGDENPRHLMKTGLAANEALYLNLPREKWDYAYAEGKWTVKEVLGHIIDSERVFQYRALRFSRNDKTPLPGFDQDLYVAAGHAHNRSVESLINEYVAVRRSSITLFEHMTPEELERTGTANDHEFSVEWMARIIVGHEMHHMRIFKERYGI